MSMQVNLAVFGPEDEAGRVPSRSRQKSVTGASTNNRTDKGRASAASPSLGRSATRGMSA